MKKHYWVIVIAIAAYIIITVSKDAQNTIYRPNASVGVYDATTESEQYSLQINRSKTSGEYLLAFVELDDLGIYKNQQQVDLVLNEIKNRQKNNHTLFIVFAHGWHNNASPESSNVKGFRQLLSQISDGEQQRCSGGTCTPYNVFGIYIAWQGESVNIPLLRQLTFWHRKQVAQKVGSQGVADFLLEIESVVNRIQPEPSESVSDIDTSKMIL